MSYLSPPPEGAKQQQLHNRKHVISTLHLRRRVPPSSFPTLERKRQDGPPAALLESPQKVRPGIPILVSPAVNLSLIDVCVEPGPFGSVCNFRNFIIYL